LGLIIEGDFVAMTAGFLSYLDFLYLPAVFVITFLGILSADIFWYFLGYRFGEAILNKVNIGRFHLINSKRFNQVKDHFARGAKKTIFFAKFFYGFAHLTFIIAGTSKIKFKQFVTVSILSSFIWTAIFVNLGFFFGYNFALLHKYTKDISISLSIILVFVLIVLYVLRRETKEEV
jgi:membrane-associated protein